MRTWTKVGRPRYILCGIICAAAAGAACLLVLSRPGDMLPDRVDELDARLAEAGCALAPVSWTGREGVYAEVSRLSLSSPSVGFYGRNPQTRQAWLVQGVDFGGTNAVLYLFRDRYVVAGSDGEVLHYHLRRNWELFEVVPAGGVPSLARRAISRFDLADGFMRTELCQVGGWQVVAGRWGLNQYGGGLARSMQQAHSPDFQRAVNPFSAVGEGARGESAVLAYTGAHAGGVGWLTEARFFLGQPHKGKTAVEGESTSVPAFLISQGDVDGRAVAFGWWGDGEGASQAWRLLWRDVEPGTGRAGPWQTLRRWQPRAPVSNWARVGLAISAGHVASAMVDGKVLGIARLPRVVEGAFQVRTSPHGGAVEFDDVVVRPWPSDATGPGARVHVRSSQFARKREKGRHDPPQFGEWARGEKAFVVNDDGVPGLGITGASAVVRYPLLGDFTYRSKPDVDTGTYRFLVAETPLPQSERDVICEFDARRSEAGWSLRDGESDAFALRFGRRGDRLFARLGERETVLPVRHSGPAYLVIAPPSKAMLSPGRHEVFSSTLWHDMFEQAPTDWVWTDGRFGMNTRWACQPGWNFMAGKSVDLAAMHSKSVFDGDLAVDAFMSLASTHPHDAKFYIRSDLCISFCTDGRNLDSGYTFIFGSEGNRQTLLLKGRDTLASTREARFLFPPGTKHAPVHWRWWNFEIQKTGGRIRVLLNNETIFDVTDPDPLSDGHLAFWTVGNGFVLSRLTIAAASRRNDAGGNWHEWSSQVTDGPWHPLRPEGVLLADEDGGFRVHNPGCGGSFAVRTVADVDLRKSPTLMLPMRLGADARVNLHIEVDGKPYLLRLTAPVGRMPRLLCPASEARIGFTRNNITPAQVEAMTLGYAMPVDGMLRVELKAWLEKTGHAIGRGESRIVLTVGNSSNEDYLMAGYSGNHAGAEYWLGVPAWQ